MRFGVTEWIAAASRTWFRTLTGTSAVKPSMIAMRRPIVPPSSATVRSAAAPAPGCERTMTDVLPTRSRTASGRTATRATSSETAATVRRGAVWIGVAAGFMHRTSCDHRFFLIDRGGHKS